MKHSIKSFLLHALFASLVLVSFSGCSNSNDYEVFGSIHGIITDYSNGLPLENATVVLSPAGLTQNTDVSGYYKFENLDILQYNITVQKQGFQPNRKIVTPVSGEDMQVDIQLTTIPQ